ncbi:ATP-binding protein [Allostreptomyces psammosilenae]|uniref:Anti-sigma regulatory factor (Ser/Thr protein kinase) n=1 Tax=Allostreptomyces psammosilenae TaxID=1892865 RepID=A0A853ABI1_9ACTN|nr:ATP-binding protein [Allostreptomyces psammosilenae]NYI07732.1 anti-sigma regulatory factor (Ser/Thr protein kinase) [Allostreptomyces psammosilenae]
MCTPAESTADQAPAAAARSWRLPAEPGALRALRRAGLAAMNEWGVPEDVREDAAVVLHELAMNAVVHATTPIVVEVYPPTRSRPSVLVEVLDASPELPRRRFPGDDGESGRGLAIVDDLTERRWGWTPDGRGKRVWAYVPCRTLVE